MEQVIENKVLRKKSVKTGQKDKKTEKNIGKRKKKAQNDVNMSKKKKTVLAVKKVTTKHLITRTKALNNAVRSAFTVKDPVFNLKEDTKAVIEEDFFKVIDINSQNNNRNRINKTTSTITETSYAKIVPINNIAENGYISLSLSMESIPLHQAVKNKSIFHEIDTEYEKTIVLQNETTENINIFTSPKTSTLATNQVENKSIFKEIDTKYDEITHAKTVKDKNYFEFPNNQEQKEQSELVETVSSDLPKNEDYIISSTNLQLLVQNRFLKQENLVTNPWQKYLKYFLKYIRAPEYCKDVLCNIVANQSEINKFLTIWELRNENQGEKVAESVIKQKFVSRFNELIGLQNLGGVLINKTQVGDIIREGSLLASLVDSKMNSTPKKIILFSRDPKYKTPENQKFDFTGIRSTSNLLTPAVKSNFTDKYLRLSSKRCSNNSFIRQHGINKEQQNFFLKQAIEDENNINNTESVLNRPKKPQMLRKDRPRYSFEYTSPKSVPEEKDSPKLRPNRKLNFSQKFYDENFDFAPLKETSPNFRTKTLHNNNLSDSFEFSPPNKLSPDWDSIISNNKSPRQRKRTRGDICTPPEISAFKKTLESRENMLNKIKKFSKDSNDLGPMPIARNTPQFKYQRF